MTLSRAERDNLIRFALQAREKAYAPYSGYLVGAALLAQDGRIFTGCNIENAAFGPTNCGERTAIFNAISQGWRQFRAMAVVGGQREAKPESWPYFYPCGVCRQVMREFCADDFQVVTAKSIAEYQELRLDELLPYSFGPDQVSPFG